MNHNTLPGFFSPAAESLGERRGERERRRGERTP
jgi:hypothetical protein